MCSIVYIDKFLLISVYLLDYSIQEAYRTHPRDTSPAEPRQPVRSTASSSKAVPQRRFQKSQKTLRSSCCPATPLTPPVERERGREGEREREREGERERDREGAKVRGREGESVGDNI